MGIKQGRFPAWFFARERTSIFAENYVCCKNLYLLENFRTLQQFFNSISLYSPPKKDLKFLPLKLLTLLKIIDIIISIVNISFNKNKPYIGLWIWNVGRLNIIIVNDMSSVWMYFLNFFWRFFMSELLQKQIIFSKNIECCREVIFDLRYLDITAYTGLAESTMISYDTRAFSPYISKIAIQ